MDGAGMREVVDALGVGCCPKLEVLEMEAVAPLDDTDEVSRRLALDTRHGVRTGGSHGVWCMVLRCRCCPIR